MKSFFCGSDDNNINNNTSNHHNLTGGIAISIRNTLTDNIHKIIRINGRIMEIRLKLDLKTKNSILHSYAPHVGYHNDEIHTGPL